eukprot:TRINITY_DN2842_c0_g1_i1.p1 TRINITY_DN2842_c0_g1~~TRINITY_DN2842_c0_g1_i1.p1  ORF type:complete len:707 (-),score=207.46 TRINITY_DN2842_c0_g1_i1:50-2014(-)
MDQKPFDKILVANRGEIACRIMRSAKKMGIKTVAVFSDSDYCAPHVKLADEAVHIGGSPSGESYLRIDRIVDAALKTGAQAVHPGYGFLSENNNFVQKLEQNNIAFVGPNSRAIKAMGDKIESKLIAKEANVNVIPGFIGEVPTEEDAIRIANEVGYPVMIKASAGGGGKGMRAAHNDKEAREGYRMSKQEAMSSFGDDRILIERFVEEPRHIEIQVLCDSHGNNLYLNERECSIQRRNQKIVEEAPSPFITPEVRKQMGEQAVQLCKAVDYRSAGTVEFLVDAQRNFYFLEMNTRLQVEHPVTEYITGVDIVEWMLKIAAGENLTLSQDDIGIKGWAMETRVYAEDPLREFLPSIGRLEEYIEPNSQDGTIRVDSGVTEGSDISIYYDPMISKLITYGKNREEAIEEMKYALDNYVIRGVQNNLSILKDIMNSERFVEGRLTTKYIEEEYPNGFSVAALESEEKNFLAGVGGILYFHQYQGNGLGQKDLVVTVEGEEFEVSTIIDEEYIDIYVNGTPFAGNFGISKNIITVDHEESTTTLQLIETTDLGYTLSYNGFHYDVSVLSSLEKQLEPIMPEIKQIDLTNVVVSPMAGTLISVAVNPGDTVTIGQEIAVVEAMKMRNVLKSSKDGVVKSVFATSGAVSLDQVIVEFEE